MPMIEFARPDGQRARGHLAEPTGAPLGNVVVVQEWWGLTEQICTTCDRLAADGFRALAPDLYDGAIAKSGDEASAKMAALDFGKAVSEYVGGATEHLRKSGGKVAVLGFCMGGAITLLSAARVPGLSAAVCFYGIPPAEALDPSTIRIPLLAHFAEKDDWCTPDRVDALEQKLKAGAVPFELHRYDAQHAFFNEKRPEVHDPAAAKLAWDRSVAFLRAKLG
jgi:carboxymethylenebutenolidase